MICGSSLSPSFERFWIRPNNEYGVFTVSLEKKCPKWKKRKKEEAGEWYYFRKMIFNEQIVIWACEMFWSWMNAERFQGKISCTWVFKTGYFYCLKVIIFPFFYFKIKGSLICKWRFALSSLPYRLNKSIKITEIN